MATSTYSSARLFTKSPIPIPSQYEQTRPLLADVVAASSPPDEGLIPSGLTIRRRGAPELVSNRGAYRQHATPPRAESELNRFWLVLAGVAFFIVVAAYVF